MRFQDSPAIAQQHSALCNFDYEPDEFREYFTSPFEQYKDRIGQRFVSLGHDVEAEKELDEYEDMYRIRFEDGTEITAWGHEVCVLILDKCS